MWGLLQYELPVGREEQVHPYTAVIESKKYFSLRLCLRILFTLATDIVPLHPRQVLIYNAFQWRPPTFAHVSLILSPDKSKLSKRHGATSVGEFREQGCLAPAMLNFLSLLGWNDGTEQEIFSQEELQQKFSLDRVHKSAAVFDNQKLVRFTLVSAQAQLTPAA